MEAARLQEARLDNFINPSNVNHDSIHSTARVALIRFIEQFSENGSSPAEEDPNHDPWSAIRNINNY